MTKKLTALQDIASIILDQELAALKLANTAREETRRKIATLEQPDDWNDCSLQSSARAAMLYQTWADGRRRDLNLNLARESVAVLKAEDAARLAFGRHAALKRLNQR